MYSSKTYLFITPNLKCDINFETIIKIFFKIPEILKDFIYSNRTNRGLKSYYEMPMRYLDFRIVKNCNHQCVLVCIIVLHASQLIIMAFWKINKCI